jgi:exodeoxyribonuclease VII large subunit
MLTVPILTVSELNRNVRSWLEQDIGKVCIEGEISNLIKPASGHYYFTLKDSGAQLRCVFFRNHHAQYQDNPLQNGQHVQASGILSLYEARGDYQLIIEGIKEVGEGDLYRQFEALKQKLAASGLFDPSRKRAIPKFPGTIGIVTSSSGAALQDILTTLARRFPAANIIIYPSEVQGKFAAQQLIQSILDANANKRCDVLILGRGGGSLEDLWSFNDERLAHCIANSHIPIVTGIGHETDFTIADFTADLRAATPTAAAEAVSPNLLDVLAFFKAQELRMITAVNSTLSHKRFMLKHELQKIMSPQQRLNTHWQTLDYLKSHLHQAIRHFLQRHSQILQIKTTRLQGKQPSVLVQHTKAKLMNLERLLQHHMTVQIRNAHQLLHSRMATLNAVSPLATLERGYSITTFANTIAFDSRTIPVGSNIHIRLAKGHLKAKVTEKGE